MKTGIELIADERQRQINVEGYSAQHDSQHKASEFTYAIIAYAEAAKAGINCRESGITDERYISMAKSDMGRHFPWGEFKTTTDIRDLTKVGALAAALIDRLQGEVAVEVEEKPRIISSFVERHPTSGIISITINTSEKWVTYQINKVATRGFVNITMLSDNSGCTESIEVPDFDANEYQMFSAQEKEQITIMCIPFAMIKECK